MIVTYTTSGATALRAARERPDRPILGLITRMVTARKLAVAWGIHAVHCEDASDLDEMVQKARHYAGRASPKPGSSIVITAGLPFGTPGATNLLTGRLGDLRRVGAAAPDQRGRPRIRRGRLPIRPIA